MDQTTSIEHLPPELRAALQLELDPGEALRWCGQPSPLHMFRAAIRPSVLGVVGFGFLGSMVGGLAVKTFLELRGVLPITREQPGWAALVMMLIVALGMIAAAIGSAFYPNVARRKAGRIVYAVTTTRIISLHRSPTGHVQSDIVEPSHPLHLARREHDGGIGTICVYPRLQSSGNAIPSSSLVLIGVQNPREVERTIRMTFDPPGNG
jgi:hypothetical protein